MLAKTALIFIALYRKTGLIRTQVCRHHPSCARYASDAISEFGISGLFIALMRIMRCNQFFKGGYDPI